MAFVDDQQEVFRKVIHQRERRFAWLATINMHRVVLNAVAVADLLHHFEVILGSHTQSLSFQKFSFGFKES